jgi:hypothetical protein
MAGLLLPVGIVGKAVGGGDAPGQIGVTGGSGLNNIGLYVKVWGKVASLGGGRYTLNDGSGETVVIKLYTGTLTAGASVAVSGAVSCEASGGNVTRLMFVEDASKVQIF